MKTATVFRLAALVPLLACSSPSASTTTEDRCPDESLTVDVAGSCLEGKALTLSSYGCQITFGPYTTGPARGMPRHGARMGEGGSIRQSGFRLYGEVCDPELLDSDCEGQPQFRLCDVRRVEWRLDVVCVDDQGQPACEASITE